MRIDILFFSLVTVACLGLAGCGKGDSGTATTRSATRTPPPPSTPDAASGTSGGAVDAGGATTPDASVEEVAAGGWGNLKGRFVFDGKAPEQVALSVTKDTEFCSKKPPMDETVVVNAEDGGLANVVIWLYQKSGDDAAPVHESYEATAQDKVTLDNQWCRFNGHVVPLRTSQTLLVRNLDEVGHNTKIDTLTNPPINPILPAGGELEQQFSEEERLPASVSCNIHPWMKAWLLVKDTPYMAVTGPDGTFEIQNLPTGNWTFQVWHEKSGYVSDVTMNGQQTKWSKGRVDVAIHPDTNDWGEIRISAEQLQ